MFMEIKDGVLESVDLSDIKNGVLIVPEGVKEIADNLGLINGAIDRVKRVVLPFSVTKIGNSAFKSCRNLKEINLDNITEISPYAFFECESLKNVTFPKCSYTIGEFAFAACINLTEQIDLGQVNKIGNNSFANCFRIKSILIPSTSLKRIECRAFEKCSSLKSITLPSSLKNIESGVFNTCESLEEITLPNIECVEENTFYGCKKLISINIPEGVKEIGSYAFCKCKRLKVINFPENLKKIGFSAFAQCRKLKRVDLKTVEIFSLAFSSCDSLAKLSLEGCKLAGRTFDKNKALKEFSVSDNTKFDSFDIDKKYKYIYKEDKNFIVTIDKPNVEGEISLDDLNSLNFEILILLWDEKTTLLMEIKNANVAKLYNFLFKELGKEKFIEFWHNKNIKFFKQLQFPKDFDLDYDFEPFCKFYYNLGGFLKPQKEEHISKSDKIVIQDVDYAQKVGEFIKEELKKDNNIFVRSEELFSKMKLGTFKSEFTNFFLQKDSFSKMCEEIKRDKDFIRKCYENFEEIQKTNTSHKGNQRQLKPTVDKFKNYFIKNRYEGITLANYEIAKTISPYFYCQSSFDNALRINEERVEKGTSENILDISLTEKDILSQIEELSKQIKSKGVSSVKLLDSLIKDNFSFEWLAKNDPKNFILGKLCSCCAHLEGDGYTFMHASIVDPNVQNLVIKTKDGEIIAKSTLYINREKGYGVFNNIEINTRVGINDREEIFRKFQLATVAFVAEYNREHPQIPLKKINVGMAFNKAREFIELELKKEKNLLEVIDYEEYGENCYISGACSNIEQYIVWEDDK